MLSKERIDPRVQRTKQLLVDAFIGLASQTDPASLSVQQITEKANINRATFYAHFNDLDDFLDYALSKTFLASLEPHLLEANSLTVRNLHQLGVSTYTFLANLHSCSKDKNLASTKLDTQLQQELFNIILNWINSSPANINSYSVDPKLKASTFSWAIYGLARQKDALLPEQTIKDALNQLLTLFRTL